MKKVGIRELKNSLSRYVRRVEAGERLLVTDRGRVVAMLAPPPVSEGPYAHIEEMIARGEIRPALRSGPVWGNFKTLRLPAGTAKALIDEDRDER